MRVPFMMNLSEEEIILIAGVIGYSSGDVLTEVYNELMDLLTNEQQAIARDISTAIAVKGNGYHIHEEELLYEAFKLRR